MQVENIKHIGIVINNIDKALQFYCNILGFKEFYIDNLDDFFCKNDSFRISKLINKNGDILELYQFIDKYPKTDNEYQQHNHIAFTVDNINELRKRLLEEKVIIEKIYENKKHKVLFCRDYSGNLLEFVEIK